jgi:hypothetical protein
VYFHLKLLAGKHPRRRGSIEALQRAMLAGYRPDLSTADPLFRLMLLQHAVCHVALLAERRFPDRRRRLPLVPAPAVASMLSAELLRYPRNCSEVCLTMVKAPSFLIDIVLLLLIIERPAEAYIDPGTASYVSR